MFSDKSPEDIQIEKFIVEPNSAKVKNTKRFLQVSCLESHKKLQIKVKLHGHKFQSDQIEVKIENENVLMVKAEDIHKKFERKFTLPLDSMVSKIKSRLDNTEVNTQTLFISVPIEDLSSGS